MNPSDRPVSRTPVPLASIAARAARMRSTASANSNSGRDGSPVESSIDSPATPVARRPRRSARPPRARSRSRPRSPRSPARRRPPRSPGDARAPRRARRGCRPTHRPGEPGAGRRERREAELREDARAAHVPRVGHHEATRLVKPAEFPDAIGHGCLYS